MARKHKVNKNPTNIDKLSYATVTKTLASDEVLKPEKMKALVDYLKWCDTSYPDFDWAGSC